jgi:hypothetical protein
VDIVQAVGRAMRTSDDKEFGYILIPLYLQREIGESIEGALERTDFSEVWNVLQALREQDEVLNDIISQMRIDKGRRKGFDDSRFREKVEILGTEINLETLRRNITVELVDKLSVSWDERSGQLVTYKEEFGDCNVPRGYLENPKLATWTGTQRQNKKNGNLEVEKIEKLNQIGVSWNQMYQQLIAYKEEFGDCNVLRSYTNPLQLPTWVSEQRTVKKKGKLSEDKIKRLEAIGFSWNPHKDLWKQMYEELVAFKGEFGDCNVPTEYDDNPPLGRWVRKQRQKYEKGKLNPDRVQELEVLGLTWNPDQTYWNQMYQELVDCHRVHGDCNVPQKYSDNRKLASWVTTQRSLQKKGKLEIPKLEKLQELGFSWDPIENYWNQMYQRLVAYKEQHGNCNVPDKWVENPSLGTWVGSQRRRKNKGTITNLQIEKLNQLGFIWNLEKNQWGKMFQALVTYKEEFGGCNVPQTYPENPRLGQWINTQRRYKKYDRLQKEHIKRLESIGFIWNRVEDAWKQMYQELVNYHRVHGDCNVPLGYSENPQLATWVSTRRNSYKTGQLDADKIQKLDELGFSWNPDEDYWNQMYQELVEYHQAHGDCNVPLGYSENPQLATWVSTRRNSYKTGQLDADKIQKLDELSFSWNRVEDAWKQMYQELVEYHQAHGDCNVPRDYSENPQLATWVGGQRQRNNRGNLDAEKIEKLDELGFSWNPKEDQWNQMLDTLVAYKEELGDCNVPRKYSSNPQLATWVSSQRRSMKKDRLSPERIKKLNQLGFDWTPKKETESVETDQEFLQLSLLD